MLVDNLYDFTGEVPICTDLIINVVDGIMHKVEPYYTSTITGEGNT